MTEQEWLASKDPQMMLQFIQTGNSRPSTWMSGGQSVPRFTVNDRKLRLFACAVARLNGHDSKSISRVEECVESGQPNHNFNDQDAVDSGQFWRRCRSDDAARGAAHAYAGSNTANLLRCIVGNPFRPVTLPVCDSCAGHGTHEQGWPHPSQDACPDCGGTGRTKPDWLTPTALSMATVAYQERPGRECARCGGRGKYRDGHDYNRTWEDCEVCHGAGRIDDGALDPHALAVLADALEEAGCTEESIFNHLRSSGPHVRGCWVIDLLLGKE